MNLDFRQTMNCTFQKKKTVTSFWGLAAGQNLLGVGRGTGDWELEF